MNLNWTSPFFEILISSGPLLIFTGWLMIKFPPKKINGVYGYKTTEAMKSQAKWDFAQKHSAQELIKCGTILTLMSFIGLWFDNSGIGTIAAYALITLSIANIFIKIEDQLKNIN